MIVANASYGGKLTLRGIPSSSSAPTHLCVCRRSGRSGSRVVGGS